MKKFLRFYVDTLFWIFVGFACALVGFGIAEGLDSDPLFILYGLTWKQALAATLVSWFVILLICDLIIFCIEKLVRFLRFRFHIHQKNDGCHHDICKPNRHQSADPKKPDQESPKLS